MAIVSSAQLRSRVAYSGKWSLPQVAGRFAEISGSKATAVLSLTFGLVLDAQERGEPLSVRSLRGAAEKVRFHRQSESGQADWPNDSAKRAGESG